LLARFDRTCGFRYLAGGLAQGFRTVNRFRIYHSEDFAHVLRATVLITARRSGMGQLGRVAIDGTKSRANTSRHKAMSYGRMGPAEAELEADIPEPLAQLDTMNESEDDAHGVGEGGGETLKPSSQKSFADPDANMIMTSEGSLQHFYNGQVAANEVVVIVGQRSDNVAA
jgi:hypothetical protein